MNPEQQPPQQPPRPEVSWGEPLPPAQPQQAPSQSPPNEQYSIDYLNQIAGDTATKKGPSNKLFFAMIALLVVALGLFAATLLGGGGNAKAAEILMPRIDTLKEIADTHNNLLRDSDLRSANSSFQLYLENAKSDFTGPLEAINGKKSDKTLVADETAYGEEITATFDDARLNVTLDRTYAREMSYQISVLRELLKDTYESTSDDEFKTSLEAADTNFANTQKLFAEFNGS